MDWIIWLIGYHFISMDRVRREEERGSSRGNRKRVEVTTMRRQRPVHSPLQSKLINDEATPILAIKKFTPVV